MIIKKYWIDTEGKKTSLSPELIETEIEGEKWRYIAGYEYKEDGTRNVIWGGTITEKNGWLIDEKVSTMERTVIYYTRPLASGAITPNVIDTLSIDPVIGQKVSKTVTNNQDGSQTITTSYEYNGSQFVIEVEVDSVQTHNAFGTGGAMNSAWGLPNPTSDEKGNLISFGY